MIVNNQNEGIRPQHLTLIHQPAYPRVAHKPNKAVNLKDEGVE